MMKRFLTMALVAITLSASTAFAQTATDNSAEPTNKEMRVKGDKKDRKDRKDKKDRKGKKDHKNRKGGKPCSGTCRAGKCDLNPFEGLNLTEQQQTELRQLCDQQKEACKANFEARKEKKQQADSAMFAQRRAAKADRLNKIKAILTPEQYVQFLENSYLNAANPGKGMKPGKGHRDGDRKGMKPGKGQKDRKGQRPGKGERPAAPQVTQE